MEVRDLVIIGAGRLPSVPKYIKYTLISSTGWHGLAMAKTYTEVSPNANILVLDSACSIGGVWAKERLYPDLKTNNLIGTYEFSDFPMVPERFGMKERQHIPGTVVHDYLRRFADHFNLTSRIWLQQRVESAELTGNGEWLLCISTLSEGGSVVKTSALRTKRLVIATGLTSEPFIPHFPGQDSFGRSIIHSRQLATQAKDIEVAEEVTILGGNKSAWDACYSAATAGVRVNLVMRPGGGGPSWVWPVIFTPFKVSIARLAVTRFFTWFDPCIWTETDTYAWIRRALHSTWTGQRIVWTFWQALEGIVHRAHGHNSHPDQRKLKPWTSPFWMGNSLSIHNYKSNWFDLVRSGQIKVHIADVKSLSEGIVHLSNGLNLRADALICCTGWKVDPSINFLPRETTVEVGLPGEQTSEDPTTKRAKQQVLRDNPCLRRRPKRTLPIEIPPSASVSISRNTSRAYRLYRFLVPCGERFLNLRNIAFIGTHLSVNAIMVAQVQALWITAFFQDEIEYLKSHKIDYEAVQYETILHREYCKIRHPPEAGGAGERCPDLVFDSIPYVDMLLNDLGMNPLRKRGGWKEIFHRYLPVDFKGLVKEWIGKQM
jgi:hypothetical protein